MIHPSYQELIATINEGQDLDEAPVVSSRYSLVLATSNVQDRSSAELNRL